ncbi:MULTISPECIES: DUF1294 domain-containing protein [unclassified Leptolyngbya]|uniref:DUF1294 domain-containing protein n=1 Tax=unclassified Leptolyngbya TaxID=2650499 RepID=UPI001686FD20|nr:MULTISPECIES: DUF1294 domain-containing protein [unclassified Leptolyngbya]MBD1909307.1 DUF1294 domain-containing protein [Leptolyngbya sp. FACHB-8]MBD2153537.1 DUF1294 domain-containing protein [Leptolyngbya sp. FACHB-16]
MSVLQKGQLTAWKDAKGFGFIRPADGSQDVFLHISELKDSTRRPQVGDVIYYYSTLQEGKLRAQNAFIQGARCKPSPESSRHPPKFSFPVVELLLLSILPLAGSLHFAWLTMNMLPLLLYPGMSLLTFACYANDKSSAKRRTRRIPERTLHVLEFAGGWVGGFVAQRKLRHKSRKESYQIEFWAIVILHQLFWIVWLGWALSGRFEVS